MAFLLGIPVVLAALMLQVGIISRVMLLRGSADLVMLVVAAWALQEKVRTGWFWAIWAGLLVGIISALSLPAYIVIYLVITACALFLRRRVWQAPILAMFAVVLLGTLIEQGISLGVLIFLKNIPLPIAASFNQVILPSLLLNLFLALPVYSIVRDLAVWVYPVEISP